MARRRRIFGRRDESRSAPIPDAETGAGAEETGTAPADPPTAIFDGAEDLPGEAGEQAADRPGDEAKAGAGKPAPSGETEAVANIPNDGEAGAQKPVAEAEDPESWAPPAAEPPSPPQPGSETSEWASPGPKATAAERPAARPLFPRSPSSGGSSDARSSRPAPRSRARGDTGERIRIAADQAAQAAEMRAMEEILALEEDLDRARSTASGEVDESARTARAGRGARRRSQGARAPARPRARRGRGPRQGGGDAVAQAPGRVAEE